MIKYIKTFEEFTKNFGIPNSKEKIRKERKEKLENIQKKLKK